MKRSHLIIFGLVGGLGVASSDVYISSLPYLTSQYSVSPESLNFTITAYFIATAISCLLFSHIHSYISAKKCYVITILTFVSASLLIALHPSEKILILGRVIQGLCFGIIQPLLISHIRMVGKEDNLGKNMSLYSLGAEAVSTCAPLIGALLFSFLTWNSPFLFLALLVLTLFYVSSGLIFEEEKLSFRESTLYCMIEILKDKNFFKYNFLSFLMIGLAWGIVTITPYEFNNPILHGASYSVFCALYGFGNFALEREYISSHKFLQFFPFLISLMGAAAILGFVLESNSLLIFSFIFFGLLSGLFFGLSIERAFQGISKKDSSHASSLFMFSRLISSAIFIQLSSFLYFNVKPLFYFLIALTCSLIVVLSTNYVFFSSRLMNK